MILVLIIFCWTENQLKLFYHAAYKTSYHIKFLHNILDEVDGYIGRYDRTKYVALFPSD